MLLFYILIMVFLDYTFFTLTNSDLELETQQSEMHKDGNGLWMLYEAYVKLLKKEIEIQNEMLLLKDSWPLISSHQHLGTTI